MSRMNSEAAVRDQYNNADKLNTRISLHDRYSENRQPFGDWLFACYDIPRGSRILELGCGTGMMWRGHLDALRDCALILSDLSPVPTCERLAAFSALTSDSLAIAQRRL